MRQWRSLVTLSLAATMILTASCGKTGSTGGSTAAPAAPQGSAAPAPSQPARAPAPLQKVSFRLPVTATGYGAPFVLALKKGFFTDEGLDVTVGEGKGSATAVQTAANGSDNFTLADFGTGMLLVGKGATAKAVMIISQSSPLTVVAKQESGITKPKDLEGHTVGVVAGGADGQLIGPFLQAAGVDQSKVKVINVDQTAKVQTFLDGKVDAIVIWTTSELPTLEKKGAKMNLIPMRDFGINPPNIAVWAGTDLIKKDPELIKKFVRASAKGWEYAQTHEQETVDDLVAQFPMAEKDIVAGQLHNQLPLLHTDRTKNKPIGWAAPEDIAASEVLFIKYAGLTKAPSVDLYFTNEFIPVK